MPTRPTSSIDGFVPRRPVAFKPVVRMAAPTARPLPVLRPVPPRARPLSSPRSSPELDIDQLKQTQVHMANRVVVQTPQVGDSRAATAPPAAPATIEKPQAWYARAFNLVQYPLFAVIAIAAAYSTNIGQWFILGFAVLVIIRRQESRITFALAIFLLVAIPVFQLIHQPGVAENTAVYAYELLVVGTLQAIFEVYRTSKNKQISI